MRKLVKILGALLGLLLLILVIWMAVAGPLTVLRVIRYGDTQIDDFQHNPGRQLEPSDTPFTFEAGDENLDLPPALLNGHEDLDALLASNDTIAFLVIRGDTLLYERYFQGHSPSALSQAFSMSKSITSALVGIAIEDGYFEAVQQAITDLIPELNPAGFEFVTLEHLLTMMSGSSYVENDNPFGEHVILNYTPQLEQRILEFEMEGPPGEVFRYKSGDNALLGLALDRALGEETITHYAQRRLWSPLGMEFPALWSIDHAGDGLEMTWCCLAASARDFAKIGRLYLNRGRWNDQQVVPADWVALSTAPQIPQATWPEEYTEIGWRNYGFQWWLASEAAGDYFALGKDGQFLYLNPQQDILVLRLGWSSGELFSSQWISLFQRIAEENG